MKIRILALSCLFLILFSCRNEDIEEIDRQTQQDEPEFRVHTNVLVDVIHYNGDLANANVSFAEETKSSETQPVYFEGVDINKRRELFLYHHETIGDIPFQLYNIENDVNYHRVYIPNAFERIDIVSQRWSNDKVQIDMDASTLQELRGQSLYFEDINDGAAIFVEAIPGGALAVGLDGFEGFLLAEELYYLTDGTENYDLTNKEVQIQLKSDCSSCEVYQLDESSGMWKEIASQSTGNTYTIEPEQFGIFVVGSWSDYRVESGRLAHELGEAPKLELEINTRNGQLIHRVFTTNTGKWEAYLPKEDLEVHLPSECNETITVDIDANSESSNIEIDLNAWDVFQLLTKVRNCDGEQVNQNYISIHSNEGQTNLFFDESESNFIIPNCSEEVQITVSNENQTQSNTSSINNGEFKETYACNDYVEDLFVLNIGDQIDLMDQVDASLESERLLIAFSQGGEEVGKIWVKNPVIGQIQDQQLNIELHNESVNSSYQLNCSTSEEGCGFEEFIFEEFSDEGGLVKGSFKGRFWMLFEDPRRVQYEDIEGSFEFYW